MTNRKCTSGRIHERITSLRHRLERAIDSMASNVQRTPWLGRRRAFQPVPSQPLRMEDLERREMLAGDVTITEFLAKNDGGLKDGTGRSSDWIELFHAGDAPMNLEGYRLTDDAQDLGKWVFPSTEFAPGDFMLVFASGQENSDFVDPDGHLHTNFTLKRGGEYLALVGPDNGIISEFGSQDSNFPEQLSNVSYGAAQSLTLLDSESDAAYWIPSGPAHESSWTAIDFDASAAGFETGKASFGYEARPENRTNFTGAFVTEVREGLQGLYTRMEFDLTDPSAIATLNLDMQFDNGFVAYLNGTLVASEHAPENASWFSTATDRSRRDGDALDAVSFDLSDHTDSLVVGKNVLAIHALNHLSDNSDFLMVPQLTAGASDLAAVTGAPAKQGYMTSPTPGAPNVSSAEIFSGFVEDTQFSVDRGFYTESIEVEITTETPDAVIRYTTDGSQPSADQGSVYSGPISIDTMTVLRAAAFKPDHIPTNVDTQSYLFLNDVLTQTRPEDYATLPMGADYDVDPDIALSEKYQTRMLEGLQEIPTMSVALSRDDFVGPNGNYSNPTSKGMDWERPASAELIDGDGSTMFQIDAGFRVQGGASRNWEASPKHAFSLRFRDRYGDGRLDYPLFPESPVDSFDTVSLRAGYNNSWIHRDGAQRGRSQHIRDQWVRDVLLEMGNPDAGRGFPVHMYVNGLYWGIYHLTERPDAVHYAEYNGGDPDDIDARNGAEFIDGDRDAFNEMVSFARDGNWEELLKVLDIDNYIDFQIINRYGGNDDLKTDGNWRAAGGGSKRLPWHIYSWDAERVLESPTSNSRPLDPFNNIRNSLEDLTEYQARFADRVQKHFFNGGALTPERAAELFSDRADELNLAIVAESARWGDHRRPNSPYERDVDWVKEQARVLNEYFPVRTDNVLSRYRSEGLFPNLDAPVFNQHGGVIAKDLDLTLSTVSGTIYYTTDGSDPRVAGGAVAPGAMTYTGALRVTEDVMIKARVLDGEQWSALTEASFLAASDAPLRITELNFNPHDANSSPGTQEAEADNDRFEFIELTNIGSEAIDLDGVQLVETGNHDEGVRFRFAAQNLSAGERLVVVRDTDAFRSRYGASIRIAAGDSGDEEAAQGEYGGRLANGGEQITLVDAAGKTIQQFTYKTASSWPQRANGGGSSLEIIDAGGSQTDPRNWRASAAYGGSPGSAGNEVSTAIVINEVLANTATADGDRIELYNAASEIAELAGWYISDTSDDYFKATLPNPTSVAARGYAVLEPQNIGINLDGIRGGQLLIVSADENGKPLEFVDEIHFGTAARDVSLGRTQDGTFTPRASTTLGGPNSDAKVPDVFISEIHFDPTDPDGPGSLRDRDFEFIEVTNSTDAAVDLTGWHVDGDIGFEFPEGTMLADGESVVITTLRPGNTNDANKLNVIRFTTGLKPEVQLLGRFLDANGRRGSLNDQSADIQLVRPGLASVEEPELVPTIVVDAVHYQNSAPWTMDASETGKSLHRVSAASNGLIASSWIANDVSPGSFEAAVIVLPGDSNGDGQFNQLDIVAVLQAGKYKTGQAATFAEGDWNTDGFFDELDIVAALQTGAYNINGLSATMTLAKDAQDVELESAIDRALNELTLERV